MSRTTLSTTGRNRSASKNSNSRQPLGGFEAGQYGRRLKAIPTTNLAINSVIRAYGRTALARSRHLCVNNPYMVQAKEEFIAAFVGEGVKPSFIAPNSKVKEELQDVWLEWTDESDADGLTDFYGQQGIMASEMFEAGECFIRIRPRRLTDGFTVPLQLQLLPSEMVPMYYNMTLGNGRRIECGIQFSPIGQREGYWFFRHHPGEQFYNTENVGDWLYFVPASEVLHLFKPIRAGQIRGVPHTLAGIITLALLDLYDDAELERKRTAALFAAFITRNPNETDAENPLTGSPDYTRPDTGQHSYGLEPGAVTELAPGQNIAFSEPADVGINFEAFQYRALLRASAAVGQPYSTMTGDLRQTSYGSQRAGLITFKRRIRMMQSSVLIFQFCRPIVQRWIQAGLLANAFSTFGPADYVATPRDFGKRVRWITPRWDWIDPLKDLQAEKLAVDSGFKPRSDVIEEMGNDAPEVDRLIAADQARASELGLKFGETKTGFVVAPTDEDSVDTSTLAPPPSAPPGGPSAAPGGPPAAPGGSNGA